MKDTSFEKLRVYRLGENLADQIWAIVARWDSFARATVGIQLVRAADSVGANIAEGTGRGSFQDNRRFVRMARASLNETRHWLRRAHQRKLINRGQVDRLKPLIDELAPKLNAYLSSIGRSPGSEEIGNQRKLENDGRRTKDFRTCSPKSSVKPSTL